MDSDASSHGLSNAIFDGKDVDKVYRYGGSCSGTIYDPAGLQLIGRNIVVKGSTFKLTMNFAKLVARRSAPYGVHKGKGACSHR
jgi:hypothetical protein